MHAMTRYASTVLLAAAVLTLSTTAASAQSLGTFSFALAPFCNNAVMVVTQEGSTYRLAGWDDNCGAVQRYPITGTIAFNLDGTLNISFTTIRTNGIGVDTSIRNFSLGSYQGAWTDSAGNSGTSGIVGLSAPAQTQGARPGPSSTLLAGSVTTTTIQDSAVTAAKIADGTIGLADVNTAQVQARVSGSCAVGQAVRAINADGTVTCGAAGSPTVLHAELGIGGSFSSCTDLTSLNFGTVPAGTLTCDASVHALFDHVTSTTSRLEFDVETVAAGCGGSNVAVFEMPGAFPSVTGHDVSVPVHRAFTVGAGPLTAYLNGRALFIASASRQAVNFTCTFTPQ